MRVRQVALAVAGDGDLLQVSASLRTRLASGVRVSSAPNTVGRPTAWAASAKRTTPYSPSWSVTASASSSSRAASSASCSGWETPSRNEKLEWQCSSA